MQNAPTILFDPKLDESLSPEAKEKALEFHWMQRQLEKLQKNGFDMSRVEIAAIEHYEKKGVEDRTQNDIFRILAYVNFTVPRDETQYRQSIYFCPDSVALYTVFRIAADEATGHTAEDHLLLVRQPRLTQFSVTLEVPGGGVRVGETPEQASHRESIEEAYMPHRLVQAMKEQTAPTVSLGDQDNFPALGETHYAFMRVVDLSRKDWLDVRREMTGVESGDSSEWEKTKVVLARLDKAEQMIHPAWMRENARRCREHLPSVPVKQLSLEPAEPAPL